MTMMNGYRRQGWGWLLLACLLWSLPAQAQTIFNPGSTTTSGTGTTNNLVIFTGASSIGNYAGTTCTNQVIRLLSAAGAATCQTITNAYVDTSIWTGTVASGLLKAASQGVVAQAVVGTDYANGSGTNGKVAGWTASAGVLGNIADPTGCTNQFVTDVSDTLGLSCTTATLASAQFANQGTTTTVLHGNAAGNPSFGAVVSADHNITSTTCTNQFVTAISSTVAGTCGTVDLTTSVTGALPGANGGTGLATPSGAVLQSFMVWISNVGGVMSHRITAQTSVSTACGSTSCAKITGASASTNTTPSVNSVTDFTAGGGIDAGTTSRFVFNTAAQTTAWDLWHGQIVYNSSGTDLTVACFDASLNVNGTTRNRLECQFFKTVDGSVFALTTANIAAGKAIQMTFFGYLE